MYPLLEPSLNRFCFVIVCSLLTLTVALLALVGWIADIERFRSVFLGNPEMRPITAVGFIGVSVALMLFSAHKGRHREMFVTLIGIVISATSLLILFAFAFGFSTGVEGFLLPDLSEAAGIIPGGKMSPHSSFVFLLIGISIALLNAQEKLKSIGVGAVLIALVATYAAILGHLFDAAQLYDGVQGSGMAVQTAVLFVAVSVSLIVLNPQCRIVGLFLSNSLGGAAARRLIPVVILVPTGIGFLRVLGQDQGLYDTAFGTTMSTFVLVLLMCAIVFFYSRTVHEADGQRRHAEAELVEKENRYRELFDYSQGLMCIHDAEGNLITMNRASLLKLGYESSEMEGRNLREFIPKTLHGEFEAYLRQVTNHGIADGLIQMITKSGERIVARFNNILVTEDGKEPYILGHSQDVTELLKTQKMLRELSLTDELTGLYNRRGFITLAEQQLRLEGHKSTARGLMLIFADMDGLKTINDTFGHEAGSEAIKIFSTIVKSFVRSSDLVARWGGDEFIILTTGSNEENTGQMVERIREHLDEYNVTSGKPYRIACSFGIVQIDKDEKRSFDELITEADEAMYEDKRRRKAMRDDMPRFKGAVTREESDYSFSS